MSDVLKSLATTLSIDYSTACNLRCQYCHTGASDYQVLDMTPKMIDDIYEFCTEANVFSVCTSANGETTMYPRWHEDLDRFLNDPRFTLQINSNFVRDYTDEDLLALNKHQKIQLSIDSASPALMKKQRTADLRTILSNAVRLKHTMMKTGKKTELEINCTVTRNNITHIADLARLALLLQADALIVTEMAVNSDNPNMPDGVWDLSDDEAGAFVQSISDAINILNGTSTRIQVRPGLIRKLQPIAQAMNEGRPASAASLRARDNVDLELGPCMQPWSTVIVLATGSVAVCCGYSGSIGNIHDEKLIDIVNGPVARDVRAKILSGDSDLPCKTCWAAQPGTPEAFRDRVEKSVEAYDAARGVRVSAAHA